MTRYYYLIKKEDVVYDMIKYSLISLRTNFKPTSLDVIAHKGRMRVATDTTDNNQQYVIIKMGLDFSTPFKGYAAYDCEEMKTELEEEKWQHNI